MRVLVQSGLGHEVLQVVTALLQTIGAKMWKKKILKEAPNSGARGHELFGTGICLEDFVGNINFILDGRELGPHVGAAEAPLVRDFVCSGHPRDISDIHSPHLGGMCPVSVFGFCFMVSPQW